MYSASFMFSEIEPSESVTTFFLLPTNSSAADETTNTPNINRGFALSQLRQKSEHSTCVKFLNFNIFWHTY